MKYKINLILGFLLIAFLFGGCTGTPRREPRDIAPALVEVGELKIGDVCTGDYECISGICESLAWSPITGGVIVFEDITVCQDSDGEICESNDHCNQYDDLSGTYTCIDGLCFQLLGIADECSNNSECKSTHCCDDDGDSTYMCTAKACLEDPCTAGGDCDSGCCVADICASAGEIGCPCKLATDCESELICEEGQCIDLCSVPCTTAGYTCNPATGNCSCGGVECFPGYNCCKGGCSSQPCGGR